MMDIEKEGSVPEGGVKGDGRSNQQFYRSKEEKREEESD